MGARALRVLGIYALSRFLFAFVYLVSLWIGSSHGNVTFPSGSRFLEELGRLFYFADSTWYRHVALHGYAPGPVHPYQQASWAFFPLFPALVRMLAAMGLPLVPAGVLLANGAALWALWLLWQVADARGYNGEGAVWMMAFFPTSFFLSAFNNDSLLLLLLIGGYAAIGKNRRFLAFGIGILAGLCQVQGVLLSLPYAFGCRGRGRWVAVGPLLGLLGFMGYLALRTGDPLAFVHVQAAWGREPVFPGGALWRYLQHPLVVGDGGWDFRLLNLLWVVLALVLALVLLRHDPSLGFYALIQSLLPLTTTTLLAYGRFFLLTFPLFLILGRPKGTVGQGIAMGLATLFGLYAALFGLGVPATMA